MSKNDRQKQKTNRRIRLILLIGILIISTAIGLMHQYMNLGKPPGVDALCPFGGLESLITLITTGTMIRRIAVSSFILLGGVILTALLFRRSFCGNICPLGTLQELFARLGKKIFKKQFIIPGKLDKALRYLKYPLLLVIVFLSFRLGELIIRPFDPWAAYHHLTSDELFTEMLFGFIILVISLAGSMVYNRFFCKYLCPMGAALGVIGKIGLFKIKRNASTCTSCGACDKVCPVNIKVSEASSITSAECLNCQECLNTCPVTETLVVEGPKKKRLSPRTVNFLTLGIFFGVIAITTLAGSFEWGTLSLQETVEREGTFDTEMLKGSMAFEEIIQLTGIPREKVMERFNVKQEEFHEPIKNIKAAYGFEMEDVREFVKEILEGH